MSKPWDIHSDLTEERLVIVGNIIDRTRREVVDLHEPESGDGNWSLCCRAYERTINRLETAAASFPWLRIKRSGLYCLIIIGRVPIKIYRGEVDSPTPRTLMRQGPELAAQQLTLGFYSPEWFWRIVYQIDSEDLNILQITVAQFNARGDYQNPWDLPLVSPAHGVRSVTHIPKKAVEVPMPPMPPKTAISKVVENDA